MITLLLRFWKPLAGLVVLAVAAGWAWHVIKEYGDEREAHGVKETRLKWDAAVEARKHQDEQDEIENRRRNHSAEEIHAQALADIAADRDDLGNRLLSAQARFTASQEAYRVLSADAASRIASTQTEFARRLEVVRGATRAYDQSCQRDASTLTSLQGEIRPWVNIQ